MKLLRLTKTVPIRNEKYELQKWEKQGEVLVAPTNVEFVVIVPPMDNKVEITMRSGAHFFVEEALNTVDVLYAEATHQ